MGYHTEFMLTIKGKMVDGELSDLDPDETWRVLDILEALHGNGGILPLYRDGNMFGGSMKWYDSEEDMRQISEDEVFKDIVFGLEGRGEDSIDLWKAYFCNGIVQKCPGEIVYPEFDPKKLMP